MTREDLGSLFERFPPEEVEHLSAEDWAQRVAGCVRPGPDAEGLDPIYGSGIGHRLFWSLRIRTSIWRQNENPNEARRISDRMHALARLVAARYPERPATQAESAEASGSERAEARAIKAGLSEPTARRIGCLSLNGEPADLIPNDLAPEAWADRVVASLRSDAAKFRFDHSAIPALAWSMRDFLSGTLTMKRKAGQLEDARRLVAQLIALAQRLTRSYPDRAAPYMFLSECYVQAAKNAYREEDGPVALWLRQALEAAVRAASVEPENDEAQDLVQSRQVRLGKLASKEHVRQPVP